MIKSKLGGWLFIFFVTLMLIEPAMAEEAKQQLESSGVLNDVAKRFKEQASTWRPVIEAAATRLFWALATISMVWTFGMMALRKADIGEFFAEFVRFIMFTGFFWWLLTNATTGMNLAGTMVTSLQSLGGQAGGLQDSKLGPSSILDLGFDLYNSTVIATSELGWREFATKLVMQLLALSVLVILAVIAINVLLVMVSAWILLYSGIFFLGFGGSKWTSDMAINYYKTVLGVAAQLMAMVLLVAIGKQFLEHYSSQISKNMASQELAVMLVIALILLFLINKVPSMISGIVTGSSIGAIGGAGNFGAGAAMGAAMTAGAAAMGGASMIGSAVSGAVTGGAGAVSAVQAAMQAAAGGGDLDTGLGSISSSGSGSDSPVGAGDTPFAQAAGLGADGSSGSDGGTGSSGADGSGSAGSSGSDGSAGSDGGTDTSSGADGSSGSDGGGSADSSDANSAGSDTSSAADSGGGSADGGTDTSSGADGGGGSGSGEYMSASDTPFAQAGGFTGAVKLAAGTVGELAKAVGSAAKSDFQQRVSETAGGKLAARIKAKSEGNNE